MTTSSFDPARIDRLREVVAAAVERGEAPGAVALVSRRDEVHVAVAGHQTLDGAAMQRDTIFRIHSLTKPIVAAAAMTLIEECRLRLDDPVDPWLPELEDRRVLARPDALLDETVPAERAITLRDVLTFRLGYGQFFVDPETHPIMAARRDLEIDQFPEDAAGGLGPDEWLRRLGTLPLMHQPGERWGYNTGSDVLGVLISRVCGQPLEAVLRERIFAPLGMHDTGFALPPGGEGRFATAYGRDEEPGSFTRTDRAERDWRLPPDFPAGAGGLVSTLDDYHAFARMLLTGGAHAGARLLSRPAVTLMTHDHLTAEQQASGWPILDPGYGWGFGMAVAGPVGDHIWATTGRYGWYGAIESTWFNDPTADLTTIVLSQCDPGPHGMPTLWSDVWTTAAAAIGE